MASTRAKVVTEFMSLQVEGVTGIATLSSTRWWEQGDSNALRKISRHRVIALIGSVRKFWEHSVTVRLCDLVKDFMEIHLDDDGTEGDQQPATTEYELKMVLLSLMLTTGLLLCCWLSSWCLSPGSIIIKKQILSRSAKKRQKMERGVALAQRPPVLSCFFSVLCSMV